MMLKGDLATLRVFYGYVMNAVAWAEKLAYTAQ